MTTEWKATYSGEVVARIRTIKPELFRHEQLFDIEKQINLPVRFAWCGLFTVADREGRFKWRPRALKSEILPYDSLDFEVILNALAHSGLITKYEVSGEVYGVINSWKLHQVINSRESQSVIPPIDADASICMHVQTLESNMQVEEEGKGKEGVIHAHRKRCASVESEFDLEKLYQGYPRKAGKSRGMKLAAKQVRSAEDYSLLERAILNYSREVSGREAQHILYFSSFMSEWRDWAIEVQPVYSINVQPLTLEPVQ